MPRPLAVALALALAVLAAAPATRASPYPPSPAFSGIAWDWSTLRRTAQGSDQWNLTWSADGHQYTAFGDGEGFGGGRRVSNGFARIVGGAAGFAGTDLAAPFTGKVHGVFAEGATLYAWRCGAGSNTAAFAFQELWRSGDNGRSWNPAPWRFTASFYCPTFLQTGRGNPPAFGDHVHMYAPEGRRGPWHVSQSPGDVVLFRAPRGRLMDRSAYEFWTGSGWSPDLAARRPAFRDPAGVHLVSAVRHPGTGRVLLTSIFGRRGNVATYDAPSPTGPWTTVAREAAWGSGRLPTTGAVFARAFAPAWFTDGGRCFTAVFSGTGGSPLDALNTVRGCFTP